MFKRVPTGEMAGGDIGALQKAWRDSQPGEAAVAEPRRALSELENFHFDCQGFIVLPSVATPAELKEPAKLATHPVLHAYKLHAT